MEGRSSRRRRLLSAFGVIGLLAGLTATPVFTPAASADTPVTRSCGTLETGTAVTGTAVPGCSVTVSDTTNIDNGQVVTVSWSGLDTTQDVRLTQCGVPGAFPGGSGGICDAATIVKTAAQNLAAGGAGSATLTLHTGGTGATNGGGCPDPNGADSTVCSLRLSQGSTTTFATNTTVKILFNVVAPVAGTTNLAVGSTTSATLATAHEPGSCFLDSAATLTTQTYARTGDGILTVTISNSPTKCAATFTDTGTTNEDVAVPFWAKDAVNIVSASSANQTVHIAALPPTADDGSVNATAGGAAVTTTLSTTAGSLPVAGCFLDAGGTTTTGAFGSGDRTSVTISNSPTPCVATVQDTGTGSATVAVPFWAEDTGGNVSAASATETVNVQGVSPVTQAIDAAVTAGQLTVSCAAGSVSTTCPVVHLSGVTLDGTAHTATGAASSIYVTDARGSEQTWTLQAQMVASQASGGACTGAVELCNSTYSGTLPTSAHNHLAPSALSIGSLTCATVQGTNVAPTAHAGGTFAATQTLCNAASGSNTGQFKMDATYTLAVPADLFAGTFTGNVLYTLF